ncbi:MAG: 3-oxoacyl-ACP reductase, partial [Gammaproteobacteria bacterium]|nr:3-oxoacyl-ACP reductase [Gammaproteobacteria bacterium]
KLLDPASVTPAVVFLASEDAPTHQILAAGAGVFARIVIQETPGVFLDVGSRDADHVADSWRQIAATDGQQELQAGSEQTMKVLKKAAAALGIKIG